MAIGDIETLRFPMTFEDDTDDGTTPVVESAAVFTATNYDSIKSQFHQIRITKEGLVQGIMIITARRLT